MPPLSSRPFVTPGLFTPEPGLHSFEHGGAPRWRVTANRLVSYEVRVCLDLLDPADPTLLGGGVGTSDQRRRARRLVVVETRVEALYGRRIRDYFEAHRVPYEFCVIEAHERVKTMESVFKVVASMDAFGVPRRAEPVVAIGGGVLTDIVGLATSLYRRSTPYVRVPTTLIGMVDAGIGAKTGVNFDQHKNRLGTYHPSDVTLIDPGFLATLPARHLRNGMAEMLKMALVRDADLFHLLAAEGPRLVTEKLQRRPSADGGVAALRSVRRAIGGMLAELQPNLWEHQLERVVDYGHSFSPTIEMRALPDLLHGEAVSIDMALTSVLAYHRGLLTAAELERVLGVMTDLALPTWHPVCTPELLATALADTVRHRDGRQRLPLTDGIGRARFVDDVRPDELAAALAELAPGGGCHPERGRVALAGVGDPNG